MIDSFYAVLDEDGFIVEESPDFDEAVDMAAYQGAEVFVDGNATSNSVRSNPPEPPPQTSRKNSLEAAARATGFAPVTGAWIDMDYHADARPRLIERAREIFGEILNAARGTPHHGRKGGIASDVSTSWFNPRAKRALFRENQKTKKVLAGSVYEYASEGISLLPHYASFLTPFDLSLAQDASGVLTFQDRRSVDGHTLCAGSTKECRATCLVMTGQRRMESGAYAASYLFTQLFREMPDEMLAYARACILEKTRLYAEKGTRLFYRMNVFSDVPWEVIAPGFLETVVDELAAEWGTEYTDDGLFFYDYTKLRARPGTEGVYDLTFSFTGTPANTREFMGILDREPGHAKRCAAVFVMRKGSSMGYKADPGAGLKAFAEDEQYPFTFFGEPVWNGDKTDIRPLDPDDVRVVGLRYKPAMYKTFAEEGSGKVYRNLPMIPAKDLDTRMSRFLVRVMQPDPEAPPVVAATQDREARTFLNILEGDVVD